MKNPIPVHLPTEGSDLPLGTFVKDGITYFSCFAPNAERVEVEVFNDNQCEHIPLTKNASGVWTGYKVKNFLNFSYYFNVWNPQKQSLVDPYAKRLKTPKGPGIITGNFTQKPHTFKTPNPKDLIVLEVHARDLVANAPVPKDVSTFSQLTHYFSQKNYVKDLGINCVEFMPLTEFDSECKASYQWGYMPAHFFALSSSYGTPDEFSKCVQVMHKSGLAVILDVVYNHAGVMNDLIKWDENYYFRHDTCGRLTNVSGCGNDLRTEAPMVRKLILDSLLYFIKTYHIDGFRFDLAELLGLETLTFLANELKKVKKDIILIAEPWSFGGHIGYALKGSPYACWNDGYREFLLKYVNGQGNCEGFKYFLEGSTAYLCQDAQQTVNYTESHDDFCWRDRLTDNEMLVIRKTHCMFAVLLLSMGIPMIAEGQDFLRTKQHVRNTYNRGDLNILNYDKLARYHDTHLYVKKLIEFRNSDYGELLKLKRPSNQYIKYFYTQKSAIGVLFNADFSKEHKQVLFFVNPHNQCARFDLSSITTTQFTNIANTLKFVENSDKKETLTPSYEIPPNACRIFIRNISNDKIL